MYKLLIIDDEPHIIDRLQNCINWEQLNIRIIGAASNGLEGLSVAMEKHPDIILCDIRMPLMDGISFSTEYQRHFPDSQIIFLSGYSDKSYMQNAIRLKAVDYIFKPYELSDLLSAVEKAILRLKKQAPSQAVTESEDLLPELLYLTGDPSRLQDFLDAHPLKTDFEQPFFCMLVRFHTGISFSQYTQGVPENTLELQHMINGCYKDFQKNADALFENGYEMSKIGSSYLLFANTEDNDALSAATCEKLSSFLQIVSHPPVSVGASPVFHSCKDIGTAFRAARENSLSGFLVGFDGLLFEHSKRCFSTSHESREQFLQSLDRRELSDAANALNDYFTYLRNCAPEYIPAILEDLLSIALLLKEKLKSSPFHLISEFIHQANSLEDIRLYMQYLLNQYLLETDAIDHYSRIVYETEQYILQHLGDSLSVRQIADRVFISHTYLCFLYKKKTGKTIRQFILDARMQKAKRLLLDTNQKIGDIAASLGYANQNYFAKAFTAYYGNTPSSFRKKTD